MSKGSWEETRSLLEQGGVDGLERFITLSEEIYVNGGHDKLLGWANHAFKLLPKGDQTALLAMLLHDYFKLKNLEREERKAAGQ